MGEFREIWRAGHLPDVSLLVVWSGSSPNARLLTVLSKSSFLKGRQCPRRLWLAINRPPEPAVDPDEVWEMREAEGALVEAQAERLFPGIVTVSEPTDDDEPREARPDITSLAERTRLALREHLPVAQAYLQAEGLLSITDILEPREGGWFVWEVKASTSIKPIHLWDLGFQAEVARRAGLDVVGSGVIRLDPDYARGTELAPTRLLVREDCTAAVAPNEAAVRQEIAAQLASLSEAAVPTARPSSHCKVSRDAKEGNRPSTCGQLGDSGFCGTQLPVHWAGRLPRLMPPKWAEILAMADPSIERLDPAERVGKKDKWTTDQQRCIRAVKSGHPEIDPSALRAELSNLHWPIAFVDFEFDTGMAVPRFSGCQPYDLVPFQWSMLIQGQSGGGLVECDPFLHIDATDPRRPFAEALLAALPPEGSIVAHHADAETRVINQLADRLGGQVADQLRALVPRIFDTETLAKAGYCHADQKGSWSIKKLAPALLGKGYEGLGIQNGLAAVAAWKRACSESDLNTRTTLRADLLAYCGRDTSLMHDIVERLRAIAAGRP